MTGLYVRFKNWMARENGATATEYGLLVALIAFVIIGGVLAFGGALSGFFTAIGTTVTGWGDGPTP